MDERTKYFGRVGKNENVDDFYCVELGIIDAGDLSDARRAEYAQWKHQHQWNDCGFCSICGLNGNL